MSVIRKNIPGILSKMGILALNKMQEDAYDTILDNRETIIRSPTGTGKTLAYVLPILGEIDDTSSDVQVLILVPSRELAIQTEQVIRDMGTGYKINAVYGGRPISQDKRLLSHAPSILIGTPGRIADHMRRNTFVKNHIKVLVLDEFDKSLEVGFEEDMTEIIGDLTALEKKILTSATDLVDLPQFVGIKNPVYVDNKEFRSNTLTLRSITSPSKDKLSTLVDALLFIGDEPGIVFCNYRESINRVSGHLLRNNIPHGCFYGGMDQIERERALIKFRNSTHRLIVATDLASRGLDIPEIKFIIHYHLPLKAQEFTHRNGRTARMNKDGIAYILKWKEESLPEFIPQLEEAMLTQKHKLIDPPWTTLFLSGGRKDKISKGDIAGFLIKQGKLKREDVGVIELKQNCAFVAVKKKSASNIIKRLNNTHLKKRKIRITKA